MRAVLIAVGVVVFLVVSLFVARWLNTDTVERSAVTELLREQGRGDADAMLARVRCPDTRCRSVVERNARELRAPDGVEILRYDAPTSHALADETGVARVVWQSAGRLPTVQCVLVRRDGNPLTGTSVTLERLSAPIGRESSCGPVT